MKTDTSNIIFQLIKRHFFHVGPLLSDRHKSHCITAAHSRADEDEQSSSAAAGWSSSQLRAHSSLSCLGRFYFRFETVNIISISRAEQMRKATTMYVKIKNSMTGEEGMVSTSKLTTITQVKEKFFKK